MIKARVKHSMKGAAHARTIQLCRLCGEMLLNLFLGLCAQNEHDELAVGNVCRLLEGYWQWMLEETAITWMSPLGKEFDALGYITERCAPCDRCDGGRHGDFHFSA